MPQADLDQICSAPPPVLPGGPGSLAHSSGNAASAMAASSSLAVAGVRHRGLVQRKLTPAEAAAKISRATPLTGS